MHWIAGGCCIGRSWKAKNHSPLEKPFWRPSSGDFLRAGAHVLAYAPLRCSKITSIRLARAAYPQPLFLGAQGGGGGGSNIDGRRADFGHGGSFRGGDAFDRHAFTALRGCLGIGGQAGGQARG